MASNTNVDLCDICEIRGRTNHATKWCPECEEKLCDDCYGNHSATKLSRDHRVIDIEQYRKLPKSILGVKNICEKHGMKFTYLCSQHDVLCCPACTSGSGDHIKCTTKILQDVIQTAKTSVLLQSVDETLKNVKENLMTIIDDRKLNLKKLQDQKIEILKEVKQIKEKIQEHLNEFEKNILDELNNTIYNNSSKIETEIASLGEKLQQAETLFSEVHSIKEYGSDLQVFMGSRLVENKVNKLNNYFQELVKNRNMKQVDVSLKWSKKVNEIHDVMCSLGSIFEEETAVLVALAPDKRIQVQVIPSNMSIENIDITKIAKFDIIGKNLRGCLVFPNGKMIFADNKSKNLTLIKENGELEKRMPISSQPFDVTMIDENTVAVSTGEDVRVININTNTKEKFIETGRCNGLEFYKGSLFCCAPGKGVLSVDLSSSAITTVINDTTDKGWFYCTVYDDKIYTTRSAYHTVNCYTIGGDKVWNFTGLVIKNPIGIAIDNSSNIYIASHHNDSIVVLSPDRQKHRTLLTKRDGIKDPCALYFDRSKNQLVVGNERGFVLLLKI